MLDTYLTRRIAGSESDLLVDLLVVPFGEQSLLTAFDISVATVSAALDSVAYGPGAAIDGAAGLARLHDSLFVADPGAASEFQRILAEDYLPIPASPQLSTLALGGFLATGMGVEILVGADPVGIVIQEPRALVVLLVWGLSRPLRPIVDEIVMVTRRHVGAVVDRKLSRMTGVTAYPSTGTVGAGTSRGGFVRLSATAQDHAMSGTVGQPRGAELMMRVRMINDSEHDITLMNPRLDLSQPAGGTASFRSVEFGSVSGAQTIDLDAHRAVDAVFRFTVATALARGEPLIGTLHLDTSYALVPATSLEFDMIAFR